MLFLVRPGGPWGTPGGPVWPLYFFVIAAAGFLVLETVQGWGVDLTPTHMVKRLPLGKTRVAWSDIVEIGERFGRGVYVDVRDGRRLIRFPAPSGNFWPVRDQRFRRQLDTLVRWWVDHLGPSD